MTIVDFPNLTTFPEWIKQLTSLQRIQIIKCPNLTSLPNRLRSVKCLEYLEIVGCPRLKKRCEKEIGEDWPKITHVRYFFNKPDLGE